MRKGCLESLMIKDLDEEEEGVLYHRRREVIVLESACTSYLTRAHIHASVSLALRTCKCKCVLS